MSLQQKRPVIIGLTGPMASGKNKVATILEQCGCVSVDADTIAHEAIEAAKKEILSYFEPLAKEKGKKLLKADGSLDRKKLAPLVFESKQNLIAQERIIHPYVTKLLNLFIQKNKDRIIVINATVLYKIPLVHSCSAIIFVTAPLIKRLLRVKKRDTHSLWHILKRFWSQKRLFAKYKKITTDIYRVENSSSLELLETRVKKVFSLLPL